jgi:hypothetical protein
MRIYLTGRWEVRSKETINALLFTIGSANPPPLFGTLDFILAAKPISGIDSNCLPAVAKPRSFLAHSVHKLMVRREFEELRIAPLVNEYISACKRRLMTGDTAKPLKVDLTRS